MVAPSVSTIVPKGRFAPSPTGRMHLGNVYAALMSWLSVKSKGGTWLLRIEDIDPQRSRHEFARLLEEDLLWLGLEWDEGGLDGIGDAGPYLQSERGAIYAEHLERLRTMGRVYPCTCTRADIMVAGAPHVSDGRVIYGGRCRPSVMPADAPIPMPVARHAERLWVPDEEIAFEDMVYGRQTYNLARDCGDFVVRRSDGTWGYQLAVVVDDALMGVTEVVRGNDLLLSAAQQIYLYRLLGYKAPSFGHLPLLNTTAGLRLSKRDASLDMEHLRKNFTPGQIIGRIAHLAGLRPDDSPLSARDLLDGFNLTHLPASQGITVPNHQ